LGIGECGISKTWIHSIFCNSYLETITALTAEVFLEFVKKEVLVFKIIWEMKTILIYGQKSNGRS
jgi:hypothetical protein